MTVTVIIIFAVPNSAIVGLTAIDAGIFGEVQDFSQKRWLPRFKGRGSGAQLTQDTEHESEKKNKLEELLLRGAQTTAVALGVPQASLEAVMRRRSVKTGRDVIETPLREDQARAVRDGLSRAIYGRLFDWLIEHMNERLHMPNGEEDSPTPQPNGAGPGAHPDGRDRLIGILDISGFESFATNSLEQLLINLRLRGVSAVFKSEIEDCAAEGVDLGATISYVDNSDCVLLLEGRSGILDMLDEEIAMPQSSDVTFANKVLKLHGGHSRLVVPKFSGSAAFGIRHYAATVSYSCEGFLEKNAERPLSDGIIELLLSSSLPLLRVLAPRIRGQAASTSPKGIQAKLLQSCGEPNVIDAVAEYPLGRELAIVGSPPGPRDLPAFRSLLLPCWQDGSPGSLLLQRARAPPPAPEAPVAAAEHAAAVEEAVVVAEELPPPTQRPPQRPHRRGGGPREQLASGPSAPVEEEEAEQRLDAGPVLPRDDQPKRKAKRARKAKVPAEEEAEEVVGEEVELPASAEDDGAGVGDVPLEDAIQQKKRREEKAERKKMERRIERLPITFEYRLHCERKMKEIGKQLDYVQRQIQEAPAWIERAEDVERRGLAKSATLRFRRSLRDLMAKIQVAETHYVRCIKPNAANVPEAFTAGMVHEQLRYSGVLEAVRIRKQGFAARLRFEEFVHRFRCIRLLIGLPTIGEEKGDPKHTTKALLKLVGMDGPEAVLGNTKVFLKEAVLTSLEDFRSGFRKSLTMTMMNMMMVVMMMMMMMMMGVVVVVAVMVVVAVVVVAVVVAVAVAAAVAVVVMVVMTIRRKMVVLVLKKNMTITGRDEDDGSDDADEVDARDNFCCD
ncbi:Myosin-52 [Symbiodinium microadriaticum]|uniref:Myosin-52 n=1 Tax=Symbiodinium microadriaticum TaxID=2951 RepID=A0A1Q9E5Y0_SYMMI|nr:Myosin-52 [Symbiodinium microadriaticum]